MLLLSNKFQTIRINPDITVDPTVHGPGIDSVADLYPDIKKALELKPYVLSISQPVEPLKPSSKSAEDLRPSVASGRDLKPEGK